MSVQRIETMAKWVENNITENPSLQDMSSYVGYSPYYCCTKFREHMGVTYKQFLAQCKLKAAAYNPCITNELLFTMDIRHLKRLQEPFHKHFKVRHGNIEKFAVFRLAHLAHRAYCSLQICKCEEIKCLTSLEEMISAGVAAVKNIRNVIALLRNELKTTV